MLSRVNLCCYCGGGDLIFMALAAIQAKDMVGLVNKFAAKIEEKKGTVSEDEVSGVLASPI